MCHVCAARSFAAAAPCPATPPNNRPTLGQQTASRPMCHPQDVTQNWNDAWVEAGEEDGRYFHALLGVTLGAYAGGLLLPPLLLLRIAGLAHAAAPAAALPQLM